MSSKRQLHHLEKYPALNDFARFEIAWHFPESLALSSRRRLDSVRIGGTILLELMRRFDFARLRFISGSAVSSITRWQ
jgi:hypothetical protein